MWNTAEVEPFSSAAVFGIGAVGLSVIEGLIKAGANKIIAVDLLDSKLELAKEWGATDVINSRTDLKEGETIQQRIVLTFYPSHQVINILPNASNTVLLFCTY